MHKFKISKNIFDLELNDEGTGHISLYHTLNKAHVIIPESEWSYILDGSFTKANSQVMELLLQNDMLIEKQIDETAIYKAFMQNNDDFDIITSKIMVTRKCNNKCVYCFLEEKPKDMSSETALAMGRFYIDLIKNKNPLIVNDNFLGGEPLMNVDIILSSASRMKYFCLGRGIEYEFTVTTNGTLVEPDIINEMLKVGLVRLNVSMAGPNRIHEQLRPSKKGPAYNLILHNMASISSKVPIQIECQYDSSSNDYQRYSEMLEDFARYDIKIERIVYSPILPTLKDKNSFAAGMGDPEKFLFLKRETRKRGYSIDDAPPLGGPCIAECRSKFVFDVDGSFLPCPSLQSGQFAYGHVNTGINFIAKAQLLNRNLPDHCLKECNLLALCNGGCRNQAHVQKGDFWGIDCNYEIYRVLLEDYIREKSKSILEQKVLEVGVE